MDTKDPDAGVTHGQAAVGLEARGHRKLPVALLLTHSVLACACAALCVYTLYRVHRAEETWRYLTVDKGIYLNMQKALFKRPMDSAQNYILDTFKNHSTYLNFTVSWNNGLQLEHGSEVMVPFAGPYIFYICAYLTGNGNKGNLTLSQGRTNVTFELSASSGERCERRQRVISLYEKEKVTFSFRNTDDPYLQDLRIGLHYLLRNIAFDTPEIDSDY